MSHLRIGLVGCAGTGKTTLSERLSVALNLPCLRAKEITEEILVRDGYDYAAGIQVERFLAHMGRQSEMLRKTIEQQDIPRFVSDRTLVDLAAYMVVELRDEDAEKSKEIFDICRKNVGNYSHLFVCPWREGPLSANNRRTLNPWYQRMIHLVEIGLLNEWGCDYHVFKAKTPEGRCEEAREVIRRQPDFWEDVNLNEGESNE